jgi:hypothetical protein
MKKKLYHYLKEFLMKKKPHRPPIGYPAGDMPHVPLIRVVETIDLSTLDVDSLAVDSFSSDPYTDDPVAVGVELERQVSGEDSSQQSWQGMQSGAVHAAIHKELSDSVSDKRIKQLMDELYAPLVAEYADAYVLLERRYSQLLTFLMNAQLPGLGELQGTFAPRERATDGEGSGLESAQRSVPVSTTVQIEVDEDPLTVEQMGVLFSTLTTLATKYWLISQGRFADLIEFSKSHDERFLREAQAVITRLSYNSPFNFDFKLGATDVAQGFVTTIDGVLQRGERLKQMEIATKTKESELQQAEQRFAEEMQRLQQQEAFELARQQLELERLRLEVEQQRLGFLEARLDAQNKSLDHAFEIAYKVINRLYPQADDATKRMLVQTYVSDVLQLSGISFTSVTLVDQVSEEKEKKAQ